MDFDGREMAGNIGNVGRQFIKLVGEDEWIDYENQIVFPHRNGSIQIAAMESLKVPFKFLVFAGFLEHKPDGADPLLLMGSAFSQACEWTGRMTIRGLVTPILSGGHRLRPANALSMMLRVADRYEKGELHIAVPDKATYDMARPLVG